MPATWPDSFLKLANTVAERSKDPSTKVGCIIVGPDKEIRSTGYNGLPRRVSDNGIESGVLKVDPYAPQGTSPGVFA